MSNAVSLCREARPDLLEWLEQHISVRAMLAGAKVDRVTSGLGGPSLKNAYFGDCWRAPTRKARPPFRSRSPAASGKSSAGTRCTRHSYPRMVPKSPRYICTWRICGSGFRTTRLMRYVQVRHELPGHRDYYAGQPPEIRALMPAPNRRDEFYYLSPDPLFERACAADPCAENFQRWLNWATQHETGREDYIAGQWAAALPKDIPPVLHLMQSAEKTNALKRAFKLMEQAETSRRVESGRPEGTAAPVDFARHSSFAAEENPLGGTGVTPDGSAAASAAGRPAGAARGAALGLLDARRGRGPGCRRARLSGGFVGQ